MKKVLFFHPDLRGGGAEKVLVDLVNNLDPNKYTISLFTIFEEGINRKNIHPHIKQKHFFKKVFRGYSVIQRYLTPKILYRFFVKEDFDIVVAYLEGVATRVISGCDNPKTKKIAWVHTKLSEAPLSRVFWGKEDMQRIYTNYDHVVCVSQMAKSALLDYLAVAPERVSVIHNTLDVECVVKKSNEHQTTISPQKDLVTIVTVGRLTEVKGFERLLRVLVQLRNEGFAFRMFFLGEGHLLSDLQAFAMANQLQDRVHFLGFTENPYPYVKASDLFVCSSYTEGYSTAVTEAILVETPVLTTLCPGMNEILDNGAYGLIVENDESELLNGLRILLKDSALLAHYKTQAKKRKTQFMEKGKCDEVEALFDSI